MNLNRKTICFITIGTSLVFVLILAFLYYFTIKPYLTPENLNGWEHLAEFDSPDGQYTINAYRTNGGATTDFGIVCQLIYNKENKKDFTLYRSYHEKYIGVTWVDNTTVIINDRQLNVLTDHYDFREQ